MTKLQLSRVLTNDCTKLIEVQNPITTVFVGGGGGRKGPGIHCLQLHMRQIFVHEFAMNIINFFSDVQTWVETLNVTRFV